MEAALVGFLIDLGAANFASGEHDIDRCLLAALEGAYDLIDETVADQ
jgi:hypothetical protein